MLKNLSYLTAVELSILGSAAEAVGNGIAVMVAACVLYVVIERGARDAGAKEALHGLAFGLSAILAMSTSVATPIGPILDLRSLPLALAAAFTSGASPLVAGALALADRLAMGGGGAPWGAAGIVQVVVAGMLWRHYVAPNWGVTRKSLAILALLASTSNALFFAGLLANGRPVPIWMVGAVAGKVVISVVAIILAGELIKWALSRRSAKDVLHGDETLLDRPTGLLNQKGLMEALAQLGGSTDLRHPLAVMLICADPPLTDPTVFDGALLSATMEAVGPDAMAAKLRGGEFAILLTQTTPNQALDVAAKIRVKSGALVHYSIGIGHCADGSETLDLLASARTGVYAARLNGRNKDFIWPPLPD